MQRERSGGDPRGAGHRVLARAGLCALSAIVTVVIANWAVGRWCAIPALIFTLDPVLLHKLVPNSRRVLAMPEHAGGERVAVEVDSRGFRGPELGARGTTPRWIVYGDSLVLAENVREEETFVRRLARAVEEVAATQVETINAGVTGHGPDQVCLRIEAEARAGEVDGIVLVLCAHNDFGDLVRDKIFGLDAQGGLVLQPYTLDQALIADFAAKESVARRPALLRWISALRESAGSKKRAMPSDALDALHEAPPYMQWYLRAARDEHAECVREKDFRVRTLFEDYYDADVALEPESESAAYKVRLMARVIERIASTCAARGIRLFAVVVPSAVDLCGEFEIRVDRARYPAYRPSRLTDALAEILSAQHVAFVDLFELFAASDPCRLFMGREDFHWNARGQELAARAAAKQLSELGWVSRPSGR